MRENSAISPRPTRQKIPSAFFAPTNHTNLLPWIALTVRPTLGRHLHFIMNTTAKLFPAIIAATFGVTWPAAGQVFTPPQPPQAEASPAAQSHLPVEAFLGVVTDRISDELRHQFPSIKPGAGLVIRELAPASPAAQCNLERFDVLLQWNDQLLVHPAQLQVLVARAKPGEQVNLALLHQGTVTQRQITLAPRPAHLPIQPQAAQPPTPPQPPAAGLPPGLMGMLQNPEFMKQAADAIAQSGVDPAMIAGALEGLDLKNIDIAALAKEALGNSKIVLILPDGQRREIPLAESLKDGAKLDQIAKNLELDKLDPAALLGSKIQILNPDGTTLKEFSPAELMKNADAINQLLEGLGGADGH